MFPQIPENLAALSASELRGLAAEIRTAAEAVFANPESVEAFTEAQEYVAKRAEILDLAKRKDAIPAMSADDEAEPELAKDDDKDEAGEQSSKDDESGDDDDDDGDDDEASDKTEPSKEAAVPAKKVRTTFGVSEGSDKGETDERPGRLSPGKLKAKSNLVGVTAGQNFEDWGQLSEALVEQASHIRGNSNEKFQVAAIEGNFDEDHTLSDDLVANMRRFDEDLVAMMCAPAVPQYDLDCWNTNRRPVRNSFAAFKPDARGAVTIYPSPSLSDITGQSPDGVGLWTNEMDDDLENNTKTCAVIECAEPTLYRLYGVWRCLTVQNLLAMTFPELVEAYLNRLAAAHARLAETQLLEAMGTASVAVDAPTLGYGSSVSVTTSVLNLLALHQEEERWDLGEYDAWLPRWVAWAMKMDIVRRRNESGTISVPSDATINRMFSDVGVTPHWFIDTPSWAAAIPSVHTTGTLNLLPNEVNMVVAPRGKFAVMDRGELSIGVTGNNIYRDNASNSKNNFTFFFENFEALVDTNSCPAYLLTLEGVCHNGIQIADAVIDCDGAAVEAEAGGGD